MVVGQKILAAFAIFINLGIVALQETGVIQRTFGLEILCKVFF